MILVKKLSNIERQELGKALKRAKNTKWYRRLKIIELSSKGYFVSELSKMFGLSDVTVRNYIHRYNEGGLNALRYRIDAFAPDVVINDGCIGTFTVWYPGYYGALAVYGDDPTTPEKDGAAEGDPITFTITRTENGKTSVAYPVTSSNPTFRNFSFQRVDLFAD